MTTALFSGLSPEDLIAEEEEHQGTELSARSTLGKRAAPSEDSDHESQGGEEEQTSPRNENPPSRPGSTTHQNPGSLRIEQAIRRTAKRLKLPNEDISLLETFTQVSAANLILKPGGQRHRCRRPHWTCDSCFYTAAPLRSGTNLPSCNEASGPRRTRLGMNLR